MTETGEFLGNTFQFIGGKLKSLAKFILVAGILASVILGIVMFANAGNASENYILGDSLSGFYTTLGFIILIGGTIMSIICSFVLYAFGALAEKYLNEKEQRINNFKTQNMHIAQEPTYRNSSPISTNYWTCPKCGMLISNSTNVCGNCGTAKVQETVKNNNQERVLQPGEWMCSKCGRINSGYVGTCGCGEVKSSLNNTYNESEDLDEEQNKSIGILNQMLVNGQINQEEFDDRYSKIVGASNAQPQIERCPKCNSKLLDGAVFCQKCGAKVK